MPSRIFQWLIICLVACQCWACSKGDHPEVAIYLLDSFSQRLDTSTKPYRVVIEQPVLAASPLVADEDIIRYKASTHTFRLRRDIGPSMKSFGSDKAFAVTIDREPVYLGKFHPAFLSSMVFGLATIEPLLYQHEEGLTIQFILTGNPSTDNLDARNHTRLLQALRASGRLQ